MKMGESVLEVPRSGAHLPSWALSSSMSCQTLGRGGDPVKATEWSSQGPARKGRGGHGQRG